MRWPDEDPTGGEVQLSLVEITVAYGLDSVTVPQLRELIEDALILRPRHIVVCLDRCPFLDAAAIALLLRVHRGVWLSGGRLTLRSPSPRVLRILELAGVHRVFEIDGPPDSPFGFA